MILATPFYPGLTDYGLYASALKKHGQCDDHEHLVVTQRQDEVAAMAFAKKVEKLFSDTTIKVIDAVTVGGATGAANALFKTALYYFRSFKGDERIPLLYGDPTWYPQKRDWLNLIQAEYFAKDMPQVLCRSKANAAGERVSRGPTVFSRAYAVEAPLLPYLPPNGRTHWRDYMRYDIGNKSVDATTISTGDKAVLRLHRPSVKK